MKVVKFIVVHCSATPADMDIGAATLDKWHKEKGWSGIGYHNVIRRDGSIEKGRSLDEDSILEPNEVGAHVQGHNSESIGICMIGGCRRVGKTLVADNNFTPEQFVTLKAKLIRYHKQFPSAKIVGHRDLNPGKECPSFSVRDFLSSVLPQEWK